MGAKKKKLSPTIMTLVIATHTSKRARIAASAETCVQRLDIFRLKVQAWSNREIM